MQRRFGFRVALTSALSIAALYGCGSSGTKSAGATGSGAAASSTNSSSSTSSSRATSGNGGSSAGSGGAAPDGGPNDAGAGGGSPDDAGSGGATSDAGTGGDDAGATTNATVTVDTKTQVGTIGAGFAGLSYEKDHLNDGFFTPTNTSLIGLFKLLGPSVLRIGGNSVDKTTWAPTGAGNTAGVIGPPDVTALAGFIKATGWTVIYGVNMAADDPTAAAAEATYAANALGAGLYGFEIGNEPDLYASNGIRPTTWTYADFLAQWKTFYAPMHAAVPNAVFTGPASAGNVTTYTVPFAADAAADIVLLTQHYYRGNGASASSTLTELLLPDPGLIKSLGELDAAVIANHTPRGYRMAECNSFYNGGAPGISDGYGTSLWVIDYLFTLAANGSVGANFHGGGDGTGYTPIADLKSVVVEARPDYYGMFLFTLVGQGTLVGTKTNVTGVNFTAYAVSTGKGATSVVLVNKDPTITVETTVALGGAATKGVVTLLTGPSLGSTTGYTIGGSAIPPNGAWQQTSKPVVPVTNGTFVFAVPPASAALIQAQ